MSHAHGGASALGFFRGQTPRLFAHRGSVGPGAPENSLAAFDAALRAGADYLETDAHASADGVAVLAHDPRLSAGRKATVTIAESTYASLAGLLGEDTPPTLASALRAFPDTRFNIDIKVAAAALPVATAINEAAAWDRVLVASFATRRVRAVRRALEHAVAVSASSFTAGASALLARIGCMSGARFLCARVDALQIPERHGPLRLLSPALIRAAHSVGTEIHVWTVNDSDDVARLCRMGVDGIITDRVSMGRAVLDSFLRTDS